MEITADFYSDFIELNLEEIDDLKNRGFKFEEYEKWRKRKEKSVTNIISSEKSDIQETELISAYEYDLVLDFSNFLKRIPEPVRRTIHKCKDFTCPDIYQEGLDLLEKVIKTGGNLFPYLSRQIIDASKNDKMLFILGIVHFHLGTKQIKKNPLLIEGTEDILYAFIYKKNCYFIKIDKHGHWDDIELLRLLHRDFPKVLKPWKLKGVSPGQSSDNDRKNLWDKNVTTLIEIDNEAYAPPGWGISVMGTSINARFNFDRYIHYLNDIEETLISFLEKNQNKIEKKLNKKMESMNLSLIQIDPIKIFERENNLMIDIESLSNGKKISIDITNK